MDFSALFITLRIIVCQLLRLDFMGISRLARVNTMFDEDKITQNFVSTRNLFDFVDVEMDTSQPTPLPGKPKPLPDTVQ